MSVGYTREQVQKLGLRETEFCNETQLFYAKGTKPVKAIEPKKVDDGFVAVETNTAAEKETPIVLLPVNIKSITTTPKTTVENTVGESNGII